MFLLPVFVLIALVTLYNYFFPPIWPDEVLFSNTAYYLAKEGKFITPVLEGIIFGMDKATLWNSPLYMILLSIVYRFSDSLLLAGRMFSLTLGIFSTLTFFYFIKEKSNSKTAILLSIILVLDISFSRASNIIRMEILNLLFIFFTLYFLENKNRTLSGIFLGLSGLTHPISIFLIPILFLYYRLSFKHIFKTGMYAFVVMMPWFLYISHNWEIFKFQFLTQFFRKSTHYSFDSILYFIKVFGGQYQNKINFILIYLYLVFIFLLFVYDMIRNKKTIPYFLIFLIITSISFLSSEGWYSVYPVSISLLYVHSFTILYPDYKKLILVFIFFIFVAIQIVFWSKNFNKYQIYKQEYYSFIDFIKNQTQNCNIVFLQYIPDPYFDLPKNKVYKEFPPFGLFYKNLEHNNIRKNTYNSIDCFVISQKESLDPELYKLLYAKKDQFTILEIPVFKTIPTGYIYIKKL